MTAWRDGLATAGVAVDEAGASVDLVVAPSALARQAAATGAPAVLLEGRTGGGELRRAGYAVQRFLPLPDVERSDLILPLSTGAAARYVLETWRPAQTRAKHVRDRVFGTLIRTGVVPALRVEQVLGLRDPGPPFAVAEAGALGVPPNAAWFMVLGQGDPLARVAFHLFAPAEPEPSWLMKLGRVPAVRDSFDRDERGLKVASAAAGATAAHAPVLIGRFEADGLQASVESAATGEQLSSLIARDGDRARRAVEEIAAWTIEVAAETAAPTETLANERHRLRTEVLPRWLDQGAPSDLVDGLPELPGVLQHNDLGSWNIVVQPEGGFVAVDWESARRHGLPLWDLLYFLVDVLPLLEGARSAGQRVEEALRILRGESAASPILFRWLRRGIEAAGIPVDAVAHVATLCWLHHGLSHVSRRAAADLTERGSAADPSPIDLLAPRWLRDPALGLGWSAWRS
jgi:hypothetical protein